MPGWYKVCQIGRSEQQVHLQEFVAFGVIAFLVISLSPWSPTQTRVPTIGFRQDTMHPWPGAHGPWH